jgi:hypothetical protein
MKAAVSLLFQFSTCSFDTNSFLSCLPIVTDLSDHKNKSFQIQSHPNLNCFCSPFHFDIYLFFSPFRFLPILTLILLCGLAQGGIKSSVHFRIGLSLGRSGSVHLQLKRARLRLIIWFFVLFLRSLKS